LLTGHRPEDAESGPIRRLLLLLVLLGTSGLTLELVLLEHYDSFWQWSPFVVLGLGLIAGAVAAARPSRSAIRFFQVVMALSFVIGVIGVALHFQGNVEFEREIEPSARGVGLLWLSLRGATPVLAPGALAQLGLLGLAYTFRHPALRPPVR
jgi:hypothetical protein